MDELDQIIDKAIADGLSDEDIQFIVAEWKATPPVAATVGMLPQSRPDDPGYQPGLADSAVGFLQGAGERVGEMVQGITGAPATVARNVSAFAADPAGELAAYPGRAAEAIGGVAMAPVRALGDLVSGNARQAGGGAVDLATMAPAFGPAKAGVMAGARAGGRAVSPGVVSGVARVADTVGGAISVTHPWQGIVRGATGRGPASQVLKAYRGQQVASLPPNPAMGGQLARPGGQTAPGIVSMETMAQEAVNELRPMSSHTSPIPTPARVADPGTVRRPATVDPVERMEASQRTYAQDQAADAYGQGGRTRSGPSGPVTAAHGGYLDTPQGLQPLSTVTGGPMDSRMVNRATLEAHGITRPSTQPVPATPPARVTPALAPAPAAVVPELPPPSMSKGATKMSANDMQVYTKFIQAGLSPDDAMAQMLRERAIRGGTNYSTAKETAAARRQGVMERFKEQIEAEATENLGRRHAFAPPRSSLEDMLFNRDMNRPPYRMRPAHRTSFD